MLVELEGALIQEGVSLFVEFLLKVTGQFWWRWKKGSMEGLGCEIQCAIQLTSRIL